MEILEIQLEPLKPLKVINSPALEPLKPSEPIIEEQLKPLEPVIY